MNVDSGHKPLIGGGASTSSLSKLSMSGFSASGGGATITSGEKSAIDKLKRTVMQGGTAAPIKPKVMTVKLKPS